MAGGVTDATEFNALVGELGLSGTANQNGDILTEPNPTLYHQAAWGQPGQRSWGAYEYIGKTDPDVAAALEFALAQVRDARVDIEEPSKAQKDRALAETQTEFLRWALLDRLEPGWADMLRQMGRGILPGFALHELVWGEVEHETLPQGRGWSVVRMAERLPVSIHPQGWLESDGELAGIKQTGLKGSQWVDVVLPANKVQLFSWNREGNNYLGTSAFRSVHYLTRVREQLLKIVGISYMREGAGVPIAEATDVNAQLTDKQRKRLLKFLANLVFHENAACVLPAGWQMKWIHAPPQNKGGVLQAWKELGEVILRQVGAQQLVLGVNGTGSRSVGEVHDVNADQFAQGLFASMESCLNGMGRRPYTGLAKKLIDANWGPQPAYPRIAIKPRKAKLPIKERTEAMKVAKDAGFLVPTLEDENTLRDELGLKPRDPAEPVLTSPTPQPSMPPNEPPGSDDEKTDPDPTPPVPPPPPSKTSSKVTAAAKRREAGTPFVPKRPLRASELKLDLQRMADFLDSQRDAWERELRPLVLEMVARAAPDIKEAMADGLPDEVARLALDSGRIRAAIRELLEKARVEGFKQVSTELSATAQTATRLQGADPRKPSLLDAIADALTRRTEERVRSVVEDQAIEAIRTGGDEDDVVSDSVSTMLESGVVREVAESGSTRAWNAGRDEAAEEIGVQRAEYTAIMDNGTCTSCESLDGVVYEVGSDAYESAMPPNRDCDGGVRCRCTFTYLAEGE